MNDNWLGRVAAVGMRLAPVVFQGMKIRVPDYAAIANEHVILNGNGLGAQQRGIGHTDIIADVQSRPCSDDELSFRGRTNRVCTVIAIDGYIFSNDALTLLLHPEWTAHGYARCFGCFAQHPEIP